MTKQGEWTEAMNARLVKKMDLNSDGEVDDFEFAKHFEESLPRDEGKFNAIIKQFTKVANACKERKETTKAAKANKRSQTPPVQKPAAAAVVAAKQSVRPGGRRSTLLPPAVNRPHTTKARQ